MASLRSTGASAVPRSSTCSSRTEAPPICRAAQAAWS
jgi:hypothetical protein